MANPFVAEIRIFPFNFAPTGWAFCNGQLMPISQNTALFALLGTIYGGDGKSTFALPNLQGSVPMHPGQGPGLTLRDLGESGGSESVTLLESETPVHSHGMSASPGFGSANNPTNQMLARPFGGGSLYKNTGALVTLASQALAPTGGSLPHNNLQPYLTLNFCIALQGIFPPRG
ncbi:MAG: tail fiber protein [Actinomycetota bacterium]|nr:tail fiber protein [Actinomycetota bacterium]